MTCPCFISESIGVCVSSDLPFVPTVAEMEKYCFKKSFSFCPNYKPLNHKETVIMSDYESALVGLPKRESHSKAISRK